MFSKFPLLIVSLTAEPPAFSVLRTHPFFVSPFNFVIWYNFRLRKNYKSRTKILSDPLSRVPQISISSRIFLSLQALIIQFQTGRPFISGTSVWISQKEKQQSYLTPVAQKWKSGEEHGFSTIFLNVVNCPNSLYYIIQILHNKRKLQIMQSSLFIMSISLSQSFSVAQLLC